jgi:hypothetical protein
MSHSQHGALSEGLFYLSGGWIGGRAGAISSGVQLVQSNRHEGESQLEFRQFQQVRLSQNSNF